MLDQNTFMIYFLGGIFATLILTGIVIAVVFWNRRKLKFCNYLNSTATWEKESEKDFKKIHVYNGEEYDYDINDCTRDKLNRPVAHYIKGQRKQLNFKQLLDLKTHIIQIGNNKITPEDIQTHMKTKIWKDIFSDDELVTYAIITIALILITSIVLGIMISTHKQDIISCNAVELTNTTMQTIKGYCQKAITI